MSNKKQKKKEKRFPNEKDVYTFMQKFLKELLEEPDVNKSGFCMSINCFTYSMMFLRDETKEDTYALYACDKYCEYIIGKPLVSGSFDDIVSFLSCEDNTDVIMLVAQSIN